MPSVGKRIKRTTPEMGAARARPWGRDVRLGEETDELDLLQRRLESAVGGRRASVWRRRASVCGRRAAAGSLFCFYPLLSRAPNRVTHGARPIGTSARRAHPSPALPFPPGRWLAERLRSAGLPRRLSPPQRLPRASASAEALAPLRGRLWPEAKRQPPA